MLLSTSVCTWSSHFVAFSVRHSTKLNRTIKNCLASRIRTGDALSLLDVARGLENWNTCDLRRASEGHRRGQTSTSRKTIDSIEQQKIEEASNHFMISNVQTWLSKHTTHKFIDTGYYIVMPKKLIKFIFDGFRCSSATIDVVADVSTFFWFFLCSIAWAQWKIGCLRWDGKCAGCVFFSSVFLGKEKNANTVYVDEHRCYRGSHKINAVARVFAVFCVTILRPHGFISDLISTPRIHCIDIHTDEEAKYGLRECDTLAHRRSKFVFWCFMCQRQSKIVQLLAIESELNSSKICCISFTFHRIAFLTLNAMNLWQLQNTEQERINTSNLSHIRYASTWCK